MQGGSPVGDGRCWPSQGTAVLVVALQRLAYSPELAELVRESIPSIRRVVVADERLLVLGVVGISETTLKAVNLPPNPKCLLGC
jgi:hypothetical protein